MYIVLSEVQLFSEYADDFFCCGNTFSIGTSFIGFFFYYYFRNRDKRKLKPNGGEIVEDPIPMVASFLLLLF